MKIIVYAICKNEEKFIQRWYNSMKEADDIYVLDTGSTDSSLEILKKLNIHVFSKEIKPFRFDIARNESLNMVPNDVNICVCTDLDEVFEKGWRKKLENSWKKETTRARYTYNWYIVDNKPIISFYAEKIHSRKNYKWVNPVHEILESSEKENSIICDDIILNHYQDTKKSRTQYLKLLELSIKENPNNDRNMHYLGREYMYNKRWNKCIDTLIKHLNLKTATWKDERSASMRFIARSYANLKRYDEANMWLDKAIKEAPYLRDAYVEKSLLAYDLNNYKEIIKYCNKALKIKTHNKTYINEAFSWNHTIYDLLSIAYFYTGNYKLSLRNINKAIKINPNDKRLINNKKIILEKTISN
jgi:tetratricopeptide (TPR) repeat protein